MVEENSSMFEDLEKKCQERKLLIGRKISILNSVESTNTYMKNNINNMEEGQIILAKNQTGGRGRFGRNFLSPNGGIYMSILTKPNLNIENITLLTLATALSTATAIEKIIGEPVQIKWPNDIYFKKKKISGILIENIFSNNLIHSSIVGIGINANSILKNSTTEDHFRSIFEIKNSKVNLFSLALETISEFDKIYKDYFKQHSEMNSLISMYKKRMTSLGSVVTVFETTRENSPSNFIAEIIDIDRFGRLIINHNGKKRILFCEDIRVKLNYD